MLRYIVSFIILVHGLIHFMGFAKAFNYGDMKQLTLPISKPAGIMWMLAAFLFVLSVILCLAKNGYWTLAAFPAIIISQVLITMSWQDARFGTIANVLILIAAIISWNNHYFENA